MVGRLCALASIAFARAAFAFCPGGNLLRSGFTPAIVSMSLRKPHTCLASRIQPALFRTMMVAAHPLRNEKINFQIKESRVDLVAWSGDLIVVPVFEPEGDAKDKLAYLNDEALKLDAKLDGALLDLISVAELKGKAGTSSTVKMSKGYLVRKVSLVGAGKKGSFNVASAIKIGSHVASVSKSEKAKTVGVLLPEGADSDGIAALAEALAGGLYQDVRYKTGDARDKPPPLEAVDLLGPVPALAAAAVARGLTVSESVSLARDLVAGPANYVTPSTLAQAAKELAQEAGLELLVLERDECARRGMGAYLGVAQGATEAPKFIHLTYRPAGPVKKKVAVVGKGLTFDSGGYNLKAGPGSMIEMMKFDMGGAAATLGAARAVGLLKPEGVEAHFIVAACENMVSAEAMRPGDILTASNGKTIEVLNTDAEGRLTLADALVYAKALAPDGVVDLATLTGACVVSLGEEYAGLWSNNQTLADQIKASATATGEKLWQMPLCEEYVEGIKSKIADLKNIGGKGGGAITAALFLREFVDAGTPWAHLDVAGPVWSDKVGGATGYGVRTITHWIRSLS